MDKFKYQITKLPEFLCVCPLCNGAGAYRQMYTAGCGRGYYETMGPCAMCGKDYSFCGVGFLYKASSEIPPLSVINQVLTLNGYEIEARDWMVKRQLAIPYPEEIKLAA